MIGLAAGLFSVLFGVGGGLIMVPAMVYFLRIRQHRAVGTSLAAILPTALVAVLKYAEDPKVRAGLDMGVILPLAVGGVAGAVLGAILANALRGRQLRRVFAVFVVLTGMWMVYQAAGNPQAAAVREHPWPLFVGTGIVVGVVSGLLGVGGGVVTVPFLALALGYSQKVAQGISLAVIIPVSLSAAFGHYRRGNIIPSLALWLALGATLGAQIFGEWVHRIEDPVLRIMFGTFLVAVGVTMFSSRRPPAAEKGETARNA